jgi:hypothetical protein
VRGQQSGGEGRACREQVSGVQAWADARPLHFTGEKVYPGRLGTYLIAPSWPGSHWRWKPEGRWGHSTATTPEKGWTAGEMVACERSGSRS